MSIAVIFLLARYLPRYYITLTEESLLTNNGEIYFSDLDGDGQSEKLHYHQYEKIFPPTLYVYDSQDKFKLLWNLNGSPVKNSEIYIGDYNNDSVQEIFAFTTKQDTILLWVLNSQNDKQYIVEKRFITTIDANNQEFKVLPVGLFKLKDARNKEFLFAIDAIYPETPRKIYSYNIDEDLVKESLDLDIGISDNIIVDDLNADSSLEIIIAGSSVNMGAHGEIQFVVLNNDLQFLFQPEKFYGKSSGIYAQTIASGAEKNIVILHSGLTDNNVFNDLKVFDYKGELINEVSIQHEKNLILLNLNFQNKIHLFSGNKVIQYNENLEKEGSIKIKKGDKAVLVDIIDITGDNKDDIILKSKNELFFITDNLRNINKINLDLQGKAKIEAVENLVKPNQIALQSINKWYLFDIHKNEAFFYSLFFYFGIFILITFLIIVLSKIVSRYKIIKELLSKKSKENIIYELEEDLENNFVNLKSRIKEYKEVLEKDSYNQIINDIDETFQKVKKASKSVHGNITSNFRSQFVKLAERFGVDPENIFFYPEQELFEINTTLKTAILDLLKNYLLLIKKEIIDKSIIQVILHSEYINLLIEVEDNNLELSDFTDHKEITDTLNRVDGRLEVDNISDIGAIINCMLPIVNLKPGVKQRKIRVIIAEDHDVSLFGLVSLLKTKNDIEIVGTAKNGMEVLKLLETKDTDIIVTDISMPGMDGIELSGRLKNEYPEIKIIVFTMYMENWFVDQLINNGAKGFVSKNSKIIELVGAIRNVNEGYSYYCPQFKSKFGFNGNNNNISNNLDSLTKSELQVVKHYADNLTKEQIAQNMNINLITIDTFIANILLKLNAGDENEIIHIAKKQKFISE